MAKHANQQNKQGNKDVLIIIRKLGTRKDNIPRYVNNGNLSFYLQYLEMEHTFLLLFHSQIYYCYFHSQVPPIFHSCFLTVQGSRFSEQHDSTISTGTRPKKYNLIHPKNGLISKLPICSHIYGP